MNHSIKLCNVERILHYSLYYAEQTKTFHSYGMIVYATNGAWALLPDSEWNDEVGNIPTLHTFYYKDSDFDIKESLSNFMDNSMRMIISNTNWYEYDRFVDYIELLFDTPCNMHLENCFNGHINSHTIEFSS